MKTHLKENKEGKLVPAYKTSYDVEKAQMASKMARKSMRFYKHLAGIR